MPSPSPTSPRKSNTKHLTQSRAEVADRNFRRAYFASLAGSSSEQWCELKRYIDEENK